MPTTTFPARPQSLRRRPGARLAALSAGAVLLTAGCDAREAYENTFSLGFPDPVTEQGDRIYDLWLGSVAAAGIVGFFVLGLILFAVVRYRKRSDELPRQVRYNLPIEVLYTILPMVIVAVLFYYTAVTQNFVNEESKNPDMTVAVVGFQWNWQFNYQDGDQDPRNNVVETGSPRQPATLYLPTDRTIRFEETSNDVIHSFFVPKFLFKRDVIPGRVNSFEVKIHTPGVFVGRCAELCGEKHDRMNFQVVALPPAQFDQKMAELKAASPGNSPPSGAITQATPENTVEATGGSE